MTRLAEQIKSQMNKLPHGDLTELLSHLVGLLDSTVEEGAEEAWDAEISRRVEEVKSGIDEGIPADEAHRMARQRLEKRR